MSEPRDLVKELTRVDDAFAALKPSRDDELLSLLDEDRVARGARSGSGALVAAGVACALVVGVFFFFSSSSSSSSSAPTALATTTPAAPAATPSPIAVAPAPTPTTPTTTTTTMPMPMPTTMPPTMAPTPAPLRLATVPVPATRPLLPRQRDDDTGLIAMPGKGEHHSVDVNVAVVGVGGASDVALSDDDVEAGLDDVRGLRSRGDFTSAARAVEQLLAKKPGLRAQDTLGYERALLLARAHDDDGACAALRAHQAQFPRSENAADVTARLSRCP